MMNEPLHTLTADMGQPEIKAWNLMTALGHLHAEWFPDKDPNGLFLEHGAKYLADPQWTGQSLYDALVAAEAGGDQDAFSRFNVMLVAVAYCMQAVRASRKRNVAVAWPFVVEAALIVGSLVPFSDAPTSPNDPAPKMRGPSEPILSAAQRDEAVSRFDAHESVASIAELLGVSRPTIDNLLVQAGRKAKPKRKR